MTRRLRSLAVCGAGVLLALGAFRTGLRMLDGGAPWPLAALVFAVGLLLIVLAFRFRHRWDGKERAERNR